MNKNFKKVAQASALEAGQFLLKNFNKFSRRNMGTKLKSKHELVTRYDGASEKMIIKNIKKNFPAHAILAEESGQHKKRSDYLWIIDPLDGSTNFSMHNPLWNVSIALAHKDKVILGVVYVPFLNEMYIAQKGAGVTMNNKTITVSNAPADRVINAFCHGSTKESLKRAVKYYMKQKLSGFDCRQMGSAALELAFVAAGRIESMAIPGAHPWDVAAGVLIVREAGGKVTDFKGKEWTIASHDMLATNKKIHQQLLQSLKDI